MSRDLVEGCSSPTMHRILDFGDSHSALRTAGKLVPRRVLSGRRFCMGIRPPPPSRLLKGVRDPFPDSLALRTGEQEVFGVCFGRFFKVRFWVLFSGPESISGAKRRKFFCAGGRGVRPPPPRSIPLFPALANNLSGESFPGGWWRR